ncbi:MAG: DEAD/DEAH box helicase [Chitinivibrionales bacterium]|nr:DEAD/DEAH box helicase [Chitinivibrionales bacterium]
MTLFERLSRFNHRLALKLLGPRAEKLIIQGGVREIDIAAQVTLSRNVFRLSLPDALVSIIEDPKSEQKMRFICSACEGVCEHIGAAVSLVLEEKTTIGLASELPDKIQSLDLTEEELVARELMRRDERARKERLRLKSADQRKLWTDYIVTSRESGKSYRVALRGWERGESFCSCPDFRKNTLGTCKHVLFVISKVREIFPSWKRTAPFVPLKAAAYLKYENDVELRLQAPLEINETADKKLTPFLDKPIQDIQGFMTALSEYTAMGGDIIIYPDAEQYINIRLHRQNLSRLVADIRRAPERHPLRTSLLKVELLPYQMDGIAFVAGVGRAVLADDMGLGKTIQGIGVAELLARECAICRVLIVCPASVKAQWRNEINKFCGRESAVVTGGGADRFEQYRNGAFFTICNYEQVLRDLQAIEPVKWDLIILDEGQRIKNWEAKTSRTIKALKSPYALVLSGTPLENRLEELYSVMEFIDDRRLGPDFRFQHRHRVGDESGRVEGYKNLDVLRELLKPVLLRRTRDMVMKQLPPRTTEIIRITPTEEQVDIHSANKNIVAQIVRKPYLTEMDLLRLQKALLMCRMVADSTTLVNKEEPGYSTKLERLSELLPQLAAEEGRKVVLFSEWTTMLSLIEKKILMVNGIRYVRLDGSVPQKKRQVLVNQFQSDPACTFFIASNAGATGLNLQAANTVVNVDLPWNPAALEQRIGRAHRMGQKRPVQVYLMVTEGTIEESMLATLAVKKGLFGAALDIESDVTKIDLKSGIEELKNRLETLIADKPAAAIDESEQRRVEAEALNLARRETIEKAGGKLITAAFSFLQAFMPVAKEPSPETIAQMQFGLKQCSQTEPDGSLSLKLRLPDEASVNELARLMAAFAGMATGEKKT